MTGNSLSDSGARSRFWSLFEQHWHGGTGLDPAIKARDGGWTARTFVQAVKTAGLEAPDNHTIAAWMKRDWWPQEDNKDKILAAFFPPRARNDKGRQEMEEAWRCGQREPPPKRKAVAESEPQPAPQWVRYDKEDFEGLAQMAAGEPMPNSNEAGAFRIEAAPRVNVGTFEISGNNLRIGVNCVFLGFRSQGYSLRPESLISERSGAAGMKTVDGGVEFSAPDTGGCLDGPLLHGDYFAVMETDRNGEAPVTLSLRAARRAFKVTKIGANGRPKPIAASEARDAVLDILLADHQEKDSLGRVVLAKASMKRKTE